MQPDKLLRRGRKGRLCAALLLTIGLTYNSNPGRSAPMGADESASARSIASLSQAARLLADGQVDAAHELVLGLARSGEGGTEQDFLDGMISYAGKDYRRAEATFRRILDRDPRP